MLSTRRLSAVAAVAAILLTMTKLCPAHAAGAGASSSARREPSSGTFAAVPVPAATAPVVVRTVSAPGGMSSAMNELLRSVGVPVAPASRDVQANPPADGTTRLSSPSRFMNVAVVKTDADGRSRTLCVSSLDEAIRAIASDRTPAASADKE